MLKYIIRLDDACPKMNKKKWDAMEALLDKYNIKPIVGIIPDCQDEFFKKYKEITNFYIDYALNWQKKGWIIAQHGLNHNLNSIVRTEYAGKSYDEQKNNLIKGNELLIKNNIKPICFFAPAHTFDDNTVKACSDLGYFKFISDGAAIYPYKYKNMLFFPSIFDSPHKILPFGIYTFVFHPNEMNESEFKDLEKFITNNIDSFNVDLDFIIDKYMKRKRNILDFGIKLLIKIYRKIKGTKK